MADTPLHLGIYHLNRTDERLYGQNVEHVVIAHSELEARSCAGLAAGSGENGIVWVLPTTTCVVLGTANYDQVVGIVTTVRLGE